MKWLIPIGLALVVVVQGPVSADAQTAPNGVRDRAHLFSDEAIRKANAALEALRRDRGTQVAIETVESLHGANVRDRAVANAEALKIHGLYVLISRDDHKVWATPSHSAQAMFSHERIEAIIDAITRAFKAKDFDRGLLDAVALIDKDAGGKPQPGVRDDAKLFSTDAVHKANEELGAIARQSKRQVIVETVDSLHGRPIESEAVARAKAHNVDGLYILISRDDHKVWATPSRSASSVFSRAKVDAITSSMREAFRAGRFDQGLQNALAEVKRDVEGTAVASVEPPKPRNELGDAAAAKPSAPAPAIPPAPVSVPAPRASASAPRVPGDAPRVPVAAAEPSRLPMFIGIGVGAIILLWLFSRAFGGSSQSSAAGQQPGAAPGAPTGQPMYAPGPPRAPTAYGSGQPVPPAGPYPGPARGPGYGPGPGYPTGPGYAPGYGPPPQPAGGGGGFMSGMLGGLGGAVVGNILYDKFGRPQHPEGHYPPEHGSVQGGMVPPAGYPQDAGSVQPPPETYDPNAGAGGDWGDNSAAPQAEPQPQPDQWNAPDGAGGDWGSPEPQGAAENWDQGGGAGGDWGSEPAADDAGAGGDWGQDASAPPDDGGGEGGDWGQDAAGTDEQGGGGGDW